MEYIVKVGDKHIITCGKTNYEIQEKADRYSCQDVEIMKSNYDVMTGYSKTSMTLIVLVFQMVQLIVGQGADNE